jgi:acyl-CoA thioesterase FadM
VYRIDDDESDTLMVTAKTTAVSISLEERRAVPVPQEIRDRVASFEG